MGAQAAAMSAQRTEFFRNHRDAVQRAARSARQVRAMNALDTLGNRRLDYQEDRPLRLGISGDLSRF